MMMSSDFSSSMFFASLSAGAPAANSGALPPTFDVVKNTGSMWAKSFSSRMRCISTDPTMPRQPTRPTRFMIAFSFPIYSAASTASPISLVPTRVVPGS
jgi:hypothetical protein